MNWWFNYYTIEYFSVTCYSIFVRNYVPEYVRAKAILTEKKPTTNPISFLVIFLEDDFQSLLGKVEIQKTLESTKT